ncbi:hypothetical protein IV203_007915 [Nitzschia inconspicua]|uniref:Uncharacterized protein n=1 Tax=Nitzschia inconspicua TaxID=303405 RepID=A0A9K3PLK3_9STRA|nr:hypothetical protein IV203_007915 [Nitzschia inconspicua]
MDGDLLGLDGPAVDVSNVATTTTAAAAAAEAAATTTTTTDLAEHNGNGDAIAIDLLTGSPIKKQESRPTLTSLPALLSSSSDVLSSGERDTTATAFSLPSTLETDTDNDDHTVENAPVVLSSSIMNGTMDNNDNTPFQPPESVVNLLDFAENGGSSGMNDGKNVISEVSSETPSTQQNHHQEMDLFTVDASVPPMLSSTETNLLDHPDSVAPVVDQKRNDDGFVDLFAPSTTLSVVPDASSTLMGDGVSHMVDPLDAFSTSQQETSTQKNTSNDNLDPFSDMVQESSMKSPEPSLQQSTLSAAPKEEPVATTTAAETSRDSPHDESIESKEVPTNNVTVESGTKTLASPLNGNTVTETAKPELETKDNSTVDEEPQTVNGSKQSQSSPDTNSQNTNATNKDTAEGIQKQVTPIEPSTDQQRIDAQGSETIEKDRDVDDLSNSKPSSDLAVPTNAVTPTKLELTVSKEPASLQTLPPPSPAPETSDEVVLKQHIQLLEKELQAAHSLIMQLQHHENVEEERPGDAVMVELQANLQQEMNRRAEAENKMRLAQAECQKLADEYKTFKMESKASLDQLSKELETLTTEKNELLREVEQIREERDEQARKEMALTTRLNAAKKKEAVKANAAEHYEDQVEHLQQQVEQYKNELESMTAERNQLNHERTEWKNYAEKRTKQLETALNDEKKLNDERKRKMKGFVEAKTEEVRAAKAEYVSLQTELDQTSHSLKELNQRYKQLHAQWVQSQTRNRELQRDMTKMKMDSEKMLKAGGTLEARLSRSAQESEDHKNKRIQAKNELMSVLSQLEAERAVNARLQESLRMTFTPKALSQQQTIKEAIDEFEGALHRLSIRLGRPLPPPLSSNGELQSNPMADNASEDGSVLSSDFETLNDDGGRGGSSNNLSEINSNRVLQKLEIETQRVSQSIVSFSSSVERMHALLEGAGPRNCTDVFSNIFLSTQNGPSEETTAMTGERRPTRRNESRYGRVPGTLARCAEARCYTIRRLKMKEQTAPEKRRKRNSTRVGCSFQVSFTYINYKEKKTDKAIRINSSTCYRHSNGCCPSSSQLIIERQKRKAGQVATVAQDGGWGNGDAEEPLAAQEETVEQQAATVSFPAGKMNLREMLQISQDFAYSINKVTAKIKQELLQGNRYCQWKFGSN